MISKLTSSEEYASKDQDNYQNYGGFISVAIYN